MDPLSIATGAGALAKSAYKLSKDIYSGVDSIKNVDTRLISLSNEVKALAGCLTAVHVGFQDKRLPELECSFGVSESPSFTFFESTRNILVDCENALSRLDATLISIPKVGIAGNILRKPATALKLHFKADDISRIKKEIRLYTSAIQVILVSFNNSLLLQLGSKSNVGLDKLEENVNLVPKSVQALRENIESVAESDRPTTSSDSELLPTAVKRRHLERCIEIAEELRSSAATYLGSMNGSVFSLDDSQSIAEGSVKGLELDQIRNIRRWNDSDQLNGRTTEDKEDYNRMILSRRLSLAKAKLEEKRYEAAQELYVKCIVEMQALEDFPPHELREAEFNILHIYRNQQKYKEVLNGLDSLVESRDLSSGEVYLVSHIRAETYLRQGEATTALPHALKAVHGRYEMCGSDHDLYMESSNLVADIYIALNESHEAELYRQPTMLCKQAQTARPTPDYNDMDLFSGPLQRQTATTTSTLDTDISAEDKELLRYLSRNGLDLNSREAIDKALLWAAENARDDAMQLLVRLGANVNCPSSTTWTPLSYASAAGSTEQVQWLLKLGADVNGACGTTWTPLMAAACAGHTSIVVMLLQSGARLEERSKKNDTALQIARYHGHVSIVLALKEAGAKG